MIGFRKNKASSAANLVENVSRENTDTKSLPVFDDLRVPYPFEKRPTAAVISPLSPIFSDIDTSERFGDLTLLESDAIIGSSVATPLMEKNLPNDSENEGGNIFQASAGSNIEPCDPKIGSGSKSSISISDKDIDWMNSVAVDESDHLSWPLPEELHRSFPCAPFVLFRTHSLPVKSPTKENSASLNISVLESGDDSYDYHDSDSKSSQSINESQYSYNDSEDSSRESNSSISAAELGSLKNLLHLCDRIQNLIFTQEKRGTNDEIILSHSSEMKYQLSALRSMLIRSRKEKEVLEYDNRRKSEIIVHLLQLILTEETQSGRRERATAQDPPPKNRDCADDGEEGRPGPTDDEVWSCCPPEIIGLPFHRDENRGRAPNGGDDPRRPSLEGENILNKLSTFRPLDFDKKALLLNIISQNF